MTSLVQAWRLGTPDERRTLLGTIFEQMEADGAGFNRAHSSGRDGFAISRTR